MSNLQIDFLTDDEEVKRLCRLYWDVAVAPDFSTTVAELGTRFGMTAREVIKIATENCLAFSLDRACPRCKVPYIYTSRSDYQEKYRAPNRNRLCPKCAIEETEFKRTQHLKEIEQKCKAIQDTFSLEPQVPQDIRSLSLEDAICLLSFIRISASEDLSVLKSLASITQPLSPNPEYDEEIVQRLFQEELIIISPTTPPDAFEFDAGLPTRFFLNQVTWALFTGEDIEEAQHFIAQLEIVIRTKELWPPTWHEQGIELWKKIALQECLQYLAVVLQEHKLPLNVGEKTLLVLTDLLTEYSVGQIYNLIWRAGKDAAAFYMRERVSKQHAANTVVGSIQRQAERARAEGWSIKPYKRDRRCPQSMISQVLFNAALQIGEKGFEDSPNNDG